MFISQAINKAANFLLPRACMLCHCRSNTRIDLCTYCVALLPKIQQRCHICSQTLPSALEPLICGRCLKTRPRFQQAYASFSYSAPLQNVLLAFKFQRHIEYGYSLGKLMAEDISQAITLGKLGKPDLLLPMPLHPYRLIQRGYNQATALAKPIAKQLQLPIVENLAYRSQPTKKQTELSTTQERIKNVAAAFRAKDHANDKHIAIIDDILTSGATANALAKVLYQAGAKQVDVWCCARTPANVY